MTKKSKQKRICECECHKDTTGIVHEFFPCCYYPNKKYFNNNGKLDKARLPKDKPKRRKKKK